MIKYNKGCIDVFVNIIIAVLVILIAIFVIYLCYWQAHADCSDFRSVSVKDIPARCMSYYQMN